MHKLTSSYSLSLATTVYLQSIYLCGYHGPIIMPPPPSPCILPIPFFVPFSLFVLLFVYPLYCSPLSLSPVPHWQQPCEWLSAKITLLLQTNSIFFFFSLLLYSVQTGRQKKWLQRNLPASGLEECTSIKDSGES